MWYNPSNGRVYFKNPVTRHWLNCELFIRQRTIKLRHLEQFTLCVQCSIFFDYHDWPTRTNYCVRSFKYSKHVKCTLNQFALQNLPVHELRNCKLDNKNINVTRKTFTFQMPVSVSESCRRVLQPVSHSLTLVSAFLGDAIEAKTFQQQRRIIFDWKNVQQFTSFEQIQTLFWRKYFLETCRLITFSKVEKY